TDGTGRFPILHRVVMVSTLAVMSVGAHMGGNLVYGDKYLLDHTPELVRNNVDWGEKMLLAKFFGGPPPEMPNAPGENPAEPSFVAPDPATATVYAALVAPLLEAK